MSVAELGEQYGDPGLGKALLWAYEHTPCSSCRRDIVVQLDRIGLLVDDLLHECQFDSDEDTRELALRNLSRKDR